MNTQSYNSVKDAHNRRLTEIIYRVMLGREPDEDGLVHHLKALQEGKPLDMIIKEFQASEEYIKRNGSALRLTQAANTQNLQGLGPVTKQIFLSLQTEISKRKENP